MKVGGIDIYENENKHLVLKKSKFQSYFSSVVFFLIVLIIILAIIYLYKNIGPEAEIDFYPILALSTGFVTIILIFYFSLKRIIKKGTSYTLYVQNNKVTINEIVFCEKGNLGDIIIQTVSGWEGGAPSYTIGISSEKKFFPLSFNHNIDEAETIAGIISHYFEKDIIRRESKIFSLFHGH